VSWQQYLIELIYAKQSISKNKAITVVSITDFICKLELWIEKAQLFEKEKEKLLNDKFSNSA
jgi:hypothetical protein